MNKTFKTAFVLFTIMLIGKTVSLWAAENEVKIIFEGEKIVGYEENGIKVVVNPQKENKNSETPIRAEASDRDAQPAEKRSTPNDSTSLTQNNKSTVVSDTQNRVQPIEPVAGKHLMQDPDFLFPVEVHVYNRTTQKWEVRKPHFDKVGKCHFVFHDGEKYSLIVSNKSRRETAWGVLVDGFNTLSQEVNGQIEFAPEVSIDKATTRFVKSGEESRISGFYGNHKELKEMKKDDHTVDTENGDFYRAFIISKDSLTKLRNDVSNQGKIRIGVFELKTPDSSTMVTSKDTTASDKVEVKLHEKEEIVGRKIADYVIYYDVE